MTDRTPAAVTLWCATAMLGVVLLNYAAWAAGLSGGWTSATLLMFIAILVVALAAPGTWSWHALWVKLFLVALLVVALGTVTSSWDARSIWLFHGKRVFVDANLYSQLDGYFALSHNDYPVLIPALAASIARLLGGWNEVAPKLAVMLIWIPALLVIVELLPSMAARLLFLVAILLVDGAGLIDGMADMPLALNAVACAAVMQRLLNQAASDAAGVASAAAPARTRVWSVLPALLLAVMSLTKNEGIALAVLATLGFGGLALRQRTLNALRMPLSLCALSFVFAIAWMIACRTHGIVVDLGPGAPARLLARLLEPQSHLMIATHLLAVKPLLICLLVLACGLAGVAPRARLQALPLLLGMSYLALLYAVYLSTPNDLNWHLTSSASRALHTVELLFLSVGIGAYFSASGRQAADPACRMGAPWHHPGLSPGLRAGSVPGDDTGPTHINCSHRPGVTHEMATRSPEPER